MYDVVLAGCRWLENTPWGATVRGSSWMYPIALWVHFVGLSMWLGTSLAVDLRLMGVGARRQTATELSNALFVWKWIGFGVAFVGGFLLLSAEATVYVTNTGFRLKLAVLGPLALMWDALPGSLPVEARLSRLTAWVLAAERSARPFSLALPGVQLAARQGRDHRRAALTALADFPPQVSA